MSVLLSALILIPAFESLAQGNPPKPYIFEPVWTNNVGVPGGGSSWEVHERSVAGAGDVNKDGYGDIIIASKNALNGRGWVKVFHGSKKGPGLTHNWIVLGTTIANNFGHAVNTAGDVNGDGYSDIIIGEPFVNKVHVYHGSASGLPPTASWIYQSGEGNAQSFGMSVACAGDVNRDGYDDVIVGDPVPGNRVPGGYALVFLGSSNGLSIVPALKLDTDSSTDYFGYCVSGAGDLNGDGYGDIVVGGHRAGDPFTPSIALSGMARVYFGSPTGLQANTYRDLGLPTPQGNAFFGYSVSGAGDVNADGFDDLLIGVPNYKNPSYQFGAACLYSGSASGISSNATWMGMDNVPPVGEYGVSVAIVGDVNNDGRADLLVGASETDYAAGDAGSAYLYLGPRSGTQLSIGDASGVFHGKSTAAHLGEWVAPAGDVNGDGGADMLVLATGGATVYLFTGLPVPKELPKGVTLIVK